jgi:arabinogalactan oligomer/maltooligosaccharide transport system substrate-binding protein
MWHFKKLMLFFGLLLGLGAPIVTLARPSAINQWYLPIIINNPVVTEVTLWHAWDFSEQSGLQAVISAFEAAHPNIKVKTQYVLFANLRGNFETAVSSGTAPELVIGPADWGPGLLAQNKTQDLKTKIPTLLVDSLQASARGGVEYNGALVGLPHTIKGVLLYRNRNIISSSATTYSQLKANARAAQIEQDGIIQQYGAYLERGPFFVMGHLEAMGGDLMSISDGRPAFNTATGVQWLNLLKDFATFGNTSFNTDQDMLLFLSGLVGYIIDGSWNISRLSDPVEGLGASMTIDEWPTNDSGFGGGSLGGYVQTENIYLSANATGEQQSAALAFMQFMLDPTAQQILLNQSKHLPSVQGMTISNPLLQKAAMILGNGIPFPLQPELNQYWGLMESNLPQVYSGTKTPSQALSDMENGINALIP